MKPEYTLEFKVTPDDYWQAVRLQMLKNKALLVIVPILIVYALFHYISSINSEPYGLFLVKSFVTFIIFVLGMLIFIEILKVTSKRKYQRENKINLMKRKMEFNDDGIRTTTDISSGFLEYKGFTKFLKTKKITFLYISTNSFVIIPTIVIDKNDGLENFLDEKINMKREENDPNNS